MNLNYNREIKNIIFLNGLKERDVKLEPFLAVGLEEP